MFEKFATFFAIFLTSQTVSADHALRYSAATFPIEMAKKDHFVMFYAPWCEYSKQLEPIWEQLAEMFNGIEEGQVLIAKVNCDTDNTVCVENHIFGYPSLKFFKAGRRRGSRYMGLGDLGALWTFVNRKIGGVVKGPEMYRSADGRSITWVFQRMQ